MRAASLRHAANAGTLAPAATAAARFLHLSLSAGTVRHLDACPLRPDAIATLRETVLPRLARGSAVLPARPRYRLSTSLSAPGGRLFEIRARHGAGLVVARIGIGWRDHGANLVWAACGRRAEPERPWLVDALDAAGLSMLNADEAARLEQWVPSLARDLAWVATPPDAFADRVPWAEDEFPWEVRETRELEPRTLDMREPDVAGGLPIRPVDSTDPHESPTMSSDDSPPKGAGGEENQAPRMRLVGAITGGVACGTAVALFLHRGGGLLVEALAGLTLLGAAAGLVCWLTVGQQRGPSTGSSSEPEVRPFRFSRP